MKKDIDIIDKDLNYFRTEITHRVDNSLLTEEFDKYKERLEANLKDKVDVDEVQRAITACQNDTINRITAAKKEITDNLEELSNFATSTLSQKVSHSDLENRLNKFVDKNEFSDELDKL